MPAPRTCFSPQPARTTSSSSTGDSEARLPSASTSVAAGGPGARRSGRHVIFPVSAPHPRRLPRGPCRRGSGRRSRHGAGRLHRIAGHPFSPLGAAVDLLGSAPRAASPRCWCSACDSPGSWSTWAPASSHRRGCKGRCRCFRGFEENASPGAARMEIAQDRPFNVGGLVLATSSSRISRSWFQDLLPLELPQVVEEISAGVRRPRRHEPPEWASVCSPRSARPPSSIACWRSAADVNIGFGCCRRGWWFMCCW